MKVIKCSKISANTCNIMQLITPYISNIKNSFAVFLILIFNVYIQSAPTIDGELSDNEWLQAKKVLLDLEVDPGRNLPAKLKTYAYLYNDDENLYVAFEAFGNPKNIRATTRVRDTAWNEDYVLVVLDPFRDDRYAIAIGTNAMGSQLDLKQSPGSDDEDRSWNIFFYSAAKINLNGYVVELKIPFSELQYPNKDLQNWVIGFTRKSFEPGLETIFADFKNDPSDQCFFCASDKEFNIGKIKKIKRNNIYPYLTLKQNASRQDDEFSSDSPDNEIGISGLIDLNQSSSIEYAINPDFSQIEADESQIQINDTFAISFPEKRTFFLEGSDMLKNEIDFVYTRSINDPSNAFKYINQGEKNTTYALYASDENSPYLAGGTYNSFLKNIGKSKVLLVKNDLNLGNQSSIGLLVTNRDYDVGGHGRVIGIDGIFNVKTDYIIEFDLSKSDSEEPISDIFDTTQIFKNYTYALDGESFSGYAKQLKIRRVTNGSQTGFRYKEIDPEFRADLGLITRTGFKDLNYWQSLTFRNETGFRKIYFRASNQNRYDHTNKKIRDRLEMQLFFETDINIKGNFEIKRDFSEKFKVYQFGKQESNEFWLNFSPSERFSFSINGEIGDRIGYNLDNPVIGDFSSLGFTLRYKPTDQLRFDLNYDDAELKSKENNNIFFEGSIVRLATKYSFSNALSFRVNIEKNEFNDNYFLESLFQWKPDPYTIFYAGGSQYFDENNDNFKIMLSQIYIKYQYFFRY